MRYPSRLWLDDDVCQAVADYGNANDLATRFDDLAMNGYAGDQQGDCVANGADHVTVVVQDKVKLPLVSILGVLDSKFADGVRLTVVAHAAMRCDTCRTRCVHTDKGTGPNPRSGASPRCAPDLPR